MIQNKFWCDKLASIFVRLFFRVRSRKVVWFVASNQEKQIRIFPLLSRSRIWNICPYKALPLVNTATITNEGCKFQFSQTYENVFLPIIMIIMICLTGTMMIHFSRNILTFRYQTIELLIYYKRKQNLDK